MGARGDAVEHLVSRAYTLFARPAPADLGVCTACCMDPDVERAMLAKAPRDLTLHEVREWLGAAFAGDRAPVDWILPRILDLLADGADVATVGNEVALRRLRQTGFPQGWTAEQAAAVRDLCLAVLDAHVRTRGAGRLDDLLCMVASGGLDLAPFLARLDALPDDMLADLLHAEWAGARGLSIWRTAFWSGQPGRDAVWDWYLSVEERLWRAATAGNARAFAVADFLATADLRDPVA